MIFGLLYVPPETVPAEPEKLEPVIVEFPIVTELKEPLVAFTSPVNEPLVAFTSPVNEPLVAVILPVMSAFLAYTLPSRRIWKVSTPSTEQWNTLLVSLSFA